MFSEDGKLVWAAQYRTWGAINKIWQADNDNDIRGPYPPPIRGNLAFKYDTLEAEAAQTCPIRFQGQWEDAENGLYYNRYRYYDPLAAQYISPDPIGLEGGLRVNGYVHNPNAWIDPWGLIAKSLVHTERDSAFFWSGRTDGIGGQHVAADIAKQRGGTTLEMLIEKRGIPMPKWDPDIPSSIKAWEDISSEYAKGVSGTVRAVIGQELREGNIWTTKELPNLMKNPNVNKIITIDPKTGVEKTIFSRRN